MVGKRLQREMDRQGLKAWKLAEMSGIRDATIYAIVGGVSDPRVGTVCKLARALGVRPGALIEDEGEEISPPATPER